ncbi:MAG: hypothetical protein Q4B60_09390 [Erysipelotrichaceae bacterium]|nr:hypothetical protein [Erysipelotrichaceae bacterium]
MISRFEKFSLDIFSIFKNWNDIAGEEMEKYGIKGVSALYLILLNENADKYTVTELAKTCGRDKAEVSRSLAVFKEKGWLNAGEGNKYRSLLSLSEEGKKVAQSLEKRARIALINAGEGIPLEKIKVMYECLDTISANLKSLSLSGLPNE